MFTPEQTANLLNRATQLSSPDPILRANALADLTSLSGVADPFQNAPIYSSSCTSGPVYLGEGNHRVTTGAGNDQVYVGAGNDFVDAGNGNNTLYMGEGFNIAIAGLGNTTVYGGAATDIVNVGDGNHTLYLGEGINVAVIGSGINLVYAGAGDDLIRSGAGNDTIYAGEGNNFIASGTGADTVYVGSGQNQFELNIGCGSVTIIGFKPGNTLSLGEELDAGQLSFTIENGDMLLKAGDDLLATVKWTQLTSLPILDDSFSEQFTEILTDFTQQLESASNLDSIDLAPGLDAALKKIDAILSNSPDNSADLDTALAELDSILSARETAESSSLESILAELDRFAQEAWADFPAGDDRTELEAITTEFVAEVKQAIIEGYKRSTLAIPTYFANQESGQIDLGELDESDPANTTFNFASSNQPLIGIIDTGFSGTNPDIDYNRVLLGRDRIDHDSNPLLGSDEAEDHGTPILGIIGATRDNQLGINGINDKAPLWLGRAVGSGRWAESLIEFVDAAKASNQPNAVINLSFDLVQINSDGSRTTRTNLTAAERAALEYARQNRVLVVVAAGNEGGEISALGQASREFDNVITVGAVDGNARASYSSYGNGLDIVASGGTDETPVISTVEDGLGIMSGTSIASARVTGAISQVWAANPQLSYRQVIGILKATATDLKTLGWDEETGAGLLNLSASVERATRTTPAAALDAPDTSAPVLSSDLFEQAALERPAWKKPSWVKKVQGAGQKFATKLQTVTKKIARTSASLAKQAIQTTGAGLSKAWKATTATFRSISSPLDLLLPGGGRPMSSREINVAKSVFGDAIDYSKVLLDQYSVLALTSGLKSTISDRGAGGVSTSRPFVLGNTIKYFGAIDNATLIHELTHIWQYQKTGPIYISRATTDQRSEKGYDYGGIPELILRKRLVGQGTIRSFDKTAEKQATLVEDYYRLRENSKDTITSPFQTPLVPRSISGPVYASGGGTNFVNKYDLPLYAHYVQGVSTLSLEELVPQQYRPSDIAGSRTDSAFNLGTFTLGNSYQYDPEWITSDDTVDYYRFKVDSQSDWKVMMSGYAPSRPELTLGNSNDALINYPIDFIYRSADETTELYLKNLPAGEYYLRVVYTNGSTPYQLKFEPLDPDSVPLIATDLGGLNLTRRDRLRVVTDKIGFIEIYGLDRDDYYRFSLTSRNSSVALTLQSEDPVSFELYDANLKPIKVVNNLGNTFLPSKSLEPGTYYVRVSPGTDLLPTDYELTLNAFQANFPFV
ncbi:S8 family serine peptidase [Cyanobacteria bacterium FACHB-63]|nr:S8 family serine peptidase [Cyanobacteria bacterium FACHB-63]